MSKTSSTENKEQKPAKERRVAADLRLSSWKASSSAVISTKAGSPQKGQVGSQGLDDPGISIPLKEDHARCTKWRQPHTDPPSIGMIAAAIAMLLLLVLQAMHQSREALATVAGVQSDGRTGVPHARPSANADLGYFGMAV